MSVVRLLGFATLDCGCVVGRYQDVHANREVAYVEEKGADCAAHLHRRNHTIAINPAPRRFPTALEASPRDAAGCPGALSLRACGASRRCPIRSAPSPAAPPAVRSSTAIASI